MSLAEKIENPNESLVIPKWLNESKLKPLLAKDEPDYVRILQFTPVAAVPPGGNFTSVMLRVYLDLELNDGTKKRKSYVMKTALDSDKGGKGMNEFRYYHKEQQMYSTYLPAFEKLYREAGHPVQLNPKCLEIGEEEGNLYFIFEDLSAQGYQSVDRTKGIDMEHMRLSLRKLAELHAASVVYKDRHGPYPVDFEHGFAKKDNIQHSMRGFNVKAPDFKAAMTTWGMDEEYLRNFPTPDQYAKVCLESLNVDPKDFNVLTHGDFSATNLLYKYGEKGDLQEAYVLDFQICKWGSPAQDLLMMITISAEKGLRIKEFDNIVRIYWQYLIECLDILKYEKPYPQLRDLQSSLYKKNNTLYAFFCVMNHLTAHLLHVSKESNLHTIMSNNEVGRNFRTRMYTNPAYVEVIRELYPFYSNRGLFNFEDYDD
ncbi:uncharacterized protein [Drosophila kikkawai]|uniref:CHK kinase-like domain-containing protein n=1 Tax=Drosophila kikkawai TaxID=30033 RepID=A0A6P4HNQ5_DROKI|nr:uncharacterized protein LOC108071252 [Drosophila kikkawai]